MPFKEVITETESKVANSRVGFTGRAGLSCVSEDPMANIIKYSRLHGWSMLLVLLRGLIK